MNRRRFPRASRLRRRSEFERVYECGEKIVRRTMVVFVARGQGARTRLGVTATRRLGGAVVRNRAKRRVREAFRALCGELPGGLEVVVVVRPPLLEVPQERVREDLAAAVCGVARRMASS